MVFPERRSARSSAAAMEVTVSSMFTTTPRRKPCEGQVPTPTIFSFPSRSNSPTRTQIFVVPTSIPTITRSCTIHAPLGGCLDTTEVSSRYKYFLWFQRIRNTRSKTQVDGGKLQMLLPGHTQDLPQLLQAIRKRCAVLRIPQVRLPAIHANDHIRAAASLVGGYQLRALRDALDVLQRKGCSILDRGQLLKHLLHKSDIRRVQPRARMHLGRVPLIDDQTQVVCRAQLALLGYDYAILTNAKGIAPRLPEQNRHPLLNRHGDAGGQLHAQIGGSHQR